MRTTMLCLGLLSSAVVGSAGCSADVASEEAESAGEGALQSSTSKTTTRYRGSFNADGAAYSVELDVTFPTINVGSQRSYASYTPGIGLRNPLYCAVSNESIWGTMTLRVRDAAGRSVVQRTAATSTSSFSYIDHDKCSGGVLTEPAPFTSLPLRAMGGGAEFALADRTSVHVPAGYASPGFPAIAGTSTFRPLVPGTFADTSDRFSVGSEFVVARGIIGIQLPGTTTLEVGIGPTNQDPFVYARTVKVTLNAR